VFVGKETEGGIFITYSEMAMARHISQSILGNLHPSRRHSKDGVVQVGRWIIIILYVLCWR
jgi:hypothetical protein